MLDEKLFKYMRDHSSPASEALRWVEKQTHLRTNHARMLTGPVQGRLLSFLVKMSGARRILELGTFTGYSAICMAEAAGEDGRVDTLELNDELEDLILEGFERAGVASRVFLHIGDCRETIRREFPVEDFAGSFDMVYIDANKRDYPEYYCLVKPLVRKGGWILADNVLWDGKVCMDPMPQDRQTLGIAALNDMAAADPNVEQVIIPLRDGLNIIHVL